MVEHCFRARRWTVLAALSILAIAAPLRLRAAALSADVGISKSASPSSVLPGGLITYTITIEDTGIDSATGVVVTDTTPAGTTFVSFSTGASGVPCTTPSIGGTGLITCTFPSSIGVDVSFPFTMVVRVDDDATGTISNTASVSATTPDPNPDNNSATASTPVASQVPVSRGVLVVLGLAIAGGGLLVLRR